MADPQAVGKRLHLHPVYLAGHVADKRATQATFDRVAGSFDIPPRTAVVFVED